MHRAWQGHGRLSGLLHCSTRARCSGGSLAACSPLRLAAGCRPRCCGHGAAWADGLCSPRSGRRWTCSHGWCFRAGGSGIAGQGGSGDAQAKRLGAGDRGLAANKGQDAWVGMCGLGSLATWSIRHHRYCARGQFKRDSKPCTFQPEGCGLWQHSCNTRCNLGPLCCTRLGWAPLAPAHVAREACAGLAAYIRAPGAPLCAFLECCQLAAHTHASTRGGSAMKTNRLPCRPGNRTCVAIVATRHQARLWVVFRQPDWQQHA